MFWKKLGMKVTNARNWQLKPLFTELPVILPDTQLHYVALDGIIFTGGIGENSSLIRRLVMEHLAVLGVEIDTEMNNRSNSCGERIVSSENARVICAVIPTNEEKMIALDAIHLGKVNAPAEFA